MRASVASKPSPKMEIEPLGDRVLIRLVQQKEKSKGGLFIPETAKDQPQQADVLATGPGQISDAGVLLPMRVTVGERVLIGKYSGMKINIDGEEVTMVREADILGIVRTG